MTDERTTRVVEAARRAGADWAILTSVDAVCYATGHVVPIKAGPSPFAGGPTTAFVSNEGSVALVAANVEAAAAAASRADAIELYEGFGERRQARTGENYLAAAGRAADAIGAGGVAAVEPATFPSALRDGLDSRAERIVDIEPELRRVRAVKTRDELDQLRRSAEIASEGQRMALEAVAVGRSELECFGEIRLAMEEAVGARLAITGDFVSGRERTAAFTGWPTSRILRDQDPVICDLAPRVDGYWGDSCNTLFLGTPTPEFERAYEASRAGLESGLAAARPGLTAAALDTQIRSVVEGHGYRYPHHSGHSIGTSVHEFPRLVAEEQAVLEEDMVLLLEPGAYREGSGGVRLEYMIRLIPGGHELLSTFSHVVQAAPVGPNEMNSAGGIPSGS